MNRSKNILILTQWSFKDPLIQAYTLPYVNIISDTLPEGSSIYLVTFEQERLIMSVEEKKKVRIELKKKNIFLIDYTYSKFGLTGFIKWAGSFLQLFFLIFFKNIKYIHAWCTTAGSLGYLLSIFTGRPLIIDSYEPHAEAMVENETWKRTGLKFRLLFWLEKKLSHRASVLISATEGMREYAWEKYELAAKKFYLKPACVNFEKFNLDKRKNSKLINELKLEGKIVCVYAGKFGGIYLTKEVFDFFSEAEKYWGDKFRVLLLTSYDKKELSEWAKQSGFDPDKLIIRFVSYDEVQDYMGLADFGITPVKPLPTKKYCTPIKDGEYWALGLPVVITKNISDDSEIIEKNNAGAVIEHFDSEGYKKAIARIDSLLKESSPDLKNKINGIAHEYRSYKIAERVYKAIYS